MVAGCQLFYVCGHTINHLSTALPVHKAPVNDGAYGYLLASVSLHKRRLGDYKKQDWPIVPEYFLWLPISSEWKSGQTQEATSH